jgi:ribonuclease J
VDAAVADGRKVAFIGYSVEKNTRAALDLDMLNIPKGHLIDKRDMDKYPDNEICLIIAGSQGQEGSSLVRAVFGEHHVVQIKDNDKVIFSADAIPGNQTRYYAAIDELARNGIDVVYPTINENLHASGHAAAHEQRKMLQMTDPQYVMPIGGADRHRMKYIDFVADEVGYAPERVLIPGSGDVLAFDHDGRVSIDEQIRINPQLVDGLGIGDVGPVVLRDRKRLSEAGIIVLLIPRRDDGKGYDLDDIFVVSRGFVFMKEADEVIEYIKQQTAEIISGMKNNPHEGKLRRIVTDKLSKRLYGMIEREPMILPVFID